MFVVFDLDGTIANVDHRTHYVRNGNRQWGKFFAECVNDTPYQDVIDILRFLVSNGARVEIWSGRSAEVEWETVDWLDRYIGVIPLPDGREISASKLLKHMRPVNDYTPDTELKRRWLHACDQRPDFVFDDRRSVVDMWREEGLTCGQVRDWSEEEDEKLIQPHKSTVEEEMPLLTILVGAVASGKSHYAMQIFHSNEVVSSDEIRIHLCGLIEDQSRNQDVFKVIHRLVRTRLMCGLPVVVDATNMRAKDRKALVAIHDDVFKDQDYLPRVRYIVFERPLEDKLRDGGWRLGVRYKNKQGIEKNLVEHYHDRWLTCRDQALKGDGIDHVIVKHFQS